MAPSVRIHSAIGPCVGFGATLDEYYITSFNVGTNGLRLRAGIGYIMTPEKERWNWLLIEHSLSASIIYKYNDDWHGNKNTLYMGGQLNYPLLPGLGAIFPVNVEIGAYTASKFDEFLLAASVGYGF